ncbi:zinc knuckle CX2CX4HX4C containing protein [Tanacetum coccineum]
MSFSVSFDKEALEKRMAQLKERDVGVNQNVRLPIRGILKQPSAHTSAISSKEPSHVDSVRVLRNPNSTQSEGFADTLNVSSDGFVKMATADGDDVTKTWNDVGESMPMGDNIRVSTMVNSTTGMDSFIANDTDVEEVAWSSKPTGNDPTSSTYSLFGDNSFYPNSGGRSDTMGSSAVNNATPIVQSIDLSTKACSYAGAAGASKVIKPNERATVCPMIAENRFEGVNISIPRKVVAKVSTRYQNTLYGYFIGKRMAFPVVEYYAKNNWAKHGLKRIMMNAKGFFFFQFDTRDGLDTVLEGGPWMIRNSPIILKEWTMKTSLHKEELTRIPIWVKLHDVPIQVFEEEGIMG